jgi:DNA-binding transcriptional ArsR family regulator
MAVRERTPGALDDLRERPYLVGSECGGVTLMPFDHPIYVLKGDFFRVLGHPARVRILELLREGERSVGDLQAELGLDSSGTSQHLGALRRLGLVESRRQGTSVYYRARDPRVFQLLEVARQILSSSLADTQSLLDGLQETPTDTAHRPR